MAHAIDAVRRPGTRATGPTLFTLGLLQFLALVTLLGLLALLLVVLYWRLLVNPA